MQLKSLSPRQKNLREGKYLVHHDVVGFTIMWYRDKSWQWDNGSKVENVGLIFDVYKLPK